VPVVYYVLILGIFIIYLYLSNPKKDNFIILIKFIFNEKDKF